MRRLGLAGASLAHRFDRIDGSGSTVVMLHSDAETSAMGLPLLLELAQHLTVIVPSCAMLANRRSRESGSA